MHYQKPTHLIPPPTRQTGTDYGRYPSRTQDTARAYANQPSHPPPKGGSL